MSEVKEIKIIQICTLPPNEGTDEYLQRNVPSIIGLSDEGRVYQLKDAVSVEKREWVLIK